MWRPRPPREEQEPQRAAPPSSLVPGELRIIQRSDISNGSTPGQRQRIDNLLADLMRRRTEMTDAQRIARIDRISAFLRPDMQRDPAKEERIAKAKADRDADNLPDALRKKYSRGCGVCLTNPNPRVRVVLGECGHFMCEPCVNQLEDRIGDRVRCPFCRKYSGHVKLFESEEDEEQALEVV